MAFDCRTVQTDSAARNLTVFLEFMVVVAAILATTFARRSALVRNIRFLGSPPPAKKKRQQAAGGETDASLSDGLSWPDSQHGTTQSADGGGGSGGANGGHDGDSGFSFGDSGGPTTSD